MSLRFIFGAGGAGKTEYLLQYFLKHAPENFRKNWFLIVPEQDTLAMQKKILAHPANPGGGILNIDVLSFNRLAYRVFEELGLQAMTIGRPTFRSSSGVRAPAKSMKPATSSR